MGFLNNIKGVFNGGDTEILFFLLIFLVLFADYNSGIGNNCGNSDNTTILFFVILFLLLFYDNGIGPVKDC